MRDIHYLPPQQRNKSRGSDTYYGGIAENGTVRWVSLKTGSHKVAMEWFAKMQAGRYMPSRRESAYVNMEEAADAFLSEVETVRKRVCGTVTLYRIYLAKFKKFCRGCGVQDIRSATPLLCAKFAQQAFAEHSAYTSKNEVALLRQFFSWAQERYGFEGANPFKRIVVAKPKPEPRRFWTVEQCELIIAAAASDDVKCCFALMAFAGLRKEEARLLKMENLGGGKISLTGKGGKAASIPISCRLKEHLNKYLSLRGTKPGHLFQLSRKRLEHAIKSAAAKAGMEDGNAHCHRFRHSFASNLLRMGRSIKAVQMLMRHENVTLTLNTYGHLLPSDLEEAAEL